VTRGRAVGHAGGQFRLGGRRHTRIRSLRRKLRGCPRCDRPADQLIGAGQGCQGGGETDAAAGERSGSAARRVAVGDVRADRVGPDSGGQTRASIGGSVNVKYLGSPAGQVGGRWDSEFARLAPSSPASINELTCETLTDRLSRAGAWPHRNGSGSYPLSGAHSPQNELTIPAAQWRRSRKRARI